MKFLDVAQSFSLIESESSRTKKTELLAALLVQATPLDASMISYLALGSLHAVYQREQFNFAEKACLLFLLDY